MRRLLTYLYLSLACVTIAAAGDFTGGCSPRAVLSEDPATFAFGQLRPGEDSTVVVMVTNIGDEGSLLRCNVRVTDCNAAWSLVWGGGAFDLAAGDTTYYATRYAPMDDTCFAVDSCRVEVLE